MYIFYVFIDQLVDIDKLQAIMKPSENKISVKKLLLAQHTIDLTSHQGDNQSSIEAVEKDKQKKDEVKNTALSNKTKNPTKNTKSSTKICDIL